MCVNGGQTQLLKSYLTVRFGENWNEKWWVCRGRQATRSLWWKHIALLVRGSFKTGLTWIVLSVNLILNNRFFVKLKSIIIILIIKTQNGLNTSVGYDDNVTGTSQFVTTQWDNVPHFGWLSNLQWWVLLTGIVRIVRNCQKEINNNYQTEKRLKYLFY